MNMEKVSLKWDEFEANIRESFKKIRGEERLFDVTLVTDDGHHIQAHRMVLSAGSYFFSDIFMKTNHANMLIYLKGISSADLETVTDFLYNGEASVTQEELPRFLGTAKVLQINGLLDLGDLQGISENVSENHNSTHQNMSIGYNEDKSFSGNHETIDDEEIIIESMKDSFDIVNEALVKADTVKSVSNTNQELDLQIEGMIETKDGLWRCKFCGKTATTKQQTRRHAETHIEGVSHACHICSKTYSTRKYLSQHITNNHSESFSCEVCGKTGMHRGAYHSHKKIHKTLAIKK